MDKIFNKHFSYNNLELHASSRGELFGEKGPQLPSGNMLMIDRITDISNVGGSFNNGFIVAEFDINPNLWFFKCHFINDPVMPGCLGLDAMWQLVGFYLGWLGNIGKGRALGVGEVKFVGQILPSVKCITYRIDIKRIINRKLALGIADGKVFVNNRLIYIAINLKVGLFKKINV